MVRRKDPGELGVLPPLPETDAAIFFEPGKKLSSRTQTHEGFPTLRQRDLAPNFQRLFAFLEKDRRLTGPTDPY